MGDGDFIIILASKGDSDVPPFGSDVAVEEDIDFQDLRDSAIPSSSTPSPMTPLISPPLSAKSANVIASFIQSSIPRTMGDINIQSSGNTSVDDTVFTGPYKIPPPPYWRGRKEGISERISDDVPFSASSIYRKQGLPLSQTKRRYRLTVRHR